MLVVNVRKLVRMKKYRRGTCVAHTLLFQFSTTARPEIVSIYVGTLLKHLPNSRLLVMLERSTACFIASAATMRFVSISDGRFSRFSPTMKERGVCEKKTSIRGFYLAVVRVATAGLHAKRLLN